MGPPGAPRSLHRRNSSGSPRFLGDAADRASSDASGRLKALVGFIACWSRLIRWASDSRSCGTTTSAEPAIRKLTTPAAMKAARTNSSVRLARRAAGTYARIRRARVSRPARPGSTQPAGRRDTSTKTSARGSSSSSSAWASATTPEKRCEETCRGMTGWNVVDGEAREAPSRHDEGAKIILGKSGNWRGADVVRIVLEQPATADRLAWRICELLMGEGVTKPEIKALADGLRSNRLDVGWAVATVLRSHASTSSDLGSRVQSPIEYIGRRGSVLWNCSIRPSRAHWVLAPSWAARLGQDLFNPPNVGGWPGGRSWLVGPPVADRPARTSRRRLVERTIWRRSRCTRSTLILLAAKRSLPQAAAVLETVAFCARSAAGIRALIDAGSTR